jgi:hypothetical protein
MYVNVDDVPHGVSIECSSGNINIFFLLRVPATWSKTIVEGHPEHTTDKRVGRKSEDAPRNNAPGGQDNLATRRRRSQMLRRISSKERSPEIESIVETSGKRNRFSQETRWVEVHITAYRADLPFGIGDNLEGAN